MFHFYTLRGYSSGTLVENDLIIIFVKRSDYIIIYETNLYLNYRMIIKLRGDKSSYKNAVLRNFNIDETQDKANIFQLAHIVSSLTQKATLLYKYF